MLAAPSAALAARAPGWNILVLIYQNTDFTFYDGSVTRHVVAQMTPDETSVATSQSNAFVTQDIPALDSNEMVPTATIRYPGTLTDLDAFCGWWPSPRVTASALDPAYDSVIVIWASTGTDVNSGTRYDLQNCGGLTLPNGTGQTYSTFQVGSLLGGGISNSSRNIFKHEWGHSILFYYDAAGTAPRPTVDNHQPQQYVNCKTGKPYILVDETLNNPIRNSIYNNKAGFTHDYYSGTTALTGTRTCLGITAAAWASGGPVATPSGPKQGATTAATLSTLNLVPSP
jgi:hypothetical protein